MILGNYYICLFLNFDIRSLKHSGAVVNVWYSRVRNNPTQPLLACNPIFSSVLTYLIRYKYGRRVLQKPN